MSSTLPAYTALLNRLDGHQRAIAEWTPDAGHLRVVACAGSGKTTTSVALVARLVREQIVAPEHVVVTTFSRKAGDELVNRLGAVLGKGDMDALRVGTFHSLALRALRSTPAGKVRWSLDRCLDLDSRTRAQGIPAGSALWRAAVEFGKVPGTGADSLKIRDARSDDYARTCDLLRADCIDSPADLPPERAVPPQFARAWSMVLAAKRALGAWDFADVLAAWREGLAAGEYVPDARVVLVDEGQDNNRCQLALARLLASNDGRIVLVGDLRQTIHVWRGSFPDLFQHADREIGANTLEIPTNYRSLHGIVALGNRVAEGKDWSLGAPSVAARGQADVTAVEVAQGADGPDTEADEVARRIAEDMEAGASAGDYAILCRTNAARAYFEAALSERKIPIAVLGGSSIFRTREAKVVLAYALLAQHDNADALADVLNAPKRFIPNAFMDAVRRELSRGAPTIGAAVRKAAYAGSLSYGSQRGALELADTLDRFRDAEWKRVPDMIASLLVATANEDDSGDVESDAPALIAAVARIVGRFPDAASAADFSNKCVHGTSTLAEGEKGEARVTLSTVHRSKGLEWGTVFVSATTGTFPHARSVGTPQEKEEQRLFYVAVTRAKDRCVLTWSRRDGRGRPAGPSAYIGWANGSNVEA
jgi:DNA helicase-2/ATP-dependent DNA helicase PcrA